MFGLMIAIYILTCVILIVSILMQSGRGEGLGAAFGSSFGGGAIFGGRGATEFLTKVTIVSGIIFGILAIGISLYLTHGQQTTAGSVIKEKATEQVPVAAPGEEEKASSTLPQPAQSQSPAELPPTQENIPGEQPSGK